MTDKSNSTTPEREKSTSFHIAQFLVLVALAVAVYFLGLSMVHSRFHQGGHLDSHGISVGSVTQKSLSCGFRMMFLPLLHGLHRCLLELIVFRPTQRVLSPQLAKGAPLLRIRGHPSSAQSRRTPALSHTAG